MNLADDVPHFGPTKIDGGIGSGKSSGFQRCGQ
jgi:hypothetical protein